MPFLPLFPPPTSNKNEDTNKESITGIPTFDPVFINKSENNKTIDKNHSETINKEDNEIIDKKQKPKAGIPTFDMGFINKSENNGEIEKPDSTSPLYEAIDKIVEQNTEINSEKIPETNLINKIFK